MLPDEFGEMETEMFDKAAATMYAEGIICLWRNHQAESELQLRQMGGMTWPAFDTQCVNEVRGLFEQLSDDDLVASAPMTKREAALRVVMRHVHKKQWDSQAREWVAVEHKEAAGAS